MRRRGEGQKKSNLKGMRRRYTLEKKRTDRRNSQKSEQKIVGRTL